MGKPPRGALVDLGEAVYGMVAVLAERSIYMIFWALEQRRKWAKEREKELQDKLNQGVAQGRAQVLTELLSAGIIEANQDLDRWAQEKGIDLDNLPPR